MRLRGVPVLVGEGLVKPEDLITADEVESMLKVGKGWAYRNREKLPHIRIGSGKGSIRFSRSGIEAWLDQNMVHPEPAAAPARSAPRPRARRT